jgi:Ubiquitin-2 like Rad60 SUMO-like
MTSTPASAPPAKKSFFKKPTWATQAPPAESGDFFRHSDTVYDNILREKEKRKEKHAKKKQAKINDEAVEESREKKRRRISMDDEDDEDGQSASEMGTIGSQGEEVTETEADALEKEPQAKRPAAQPLRPSPSKSASHSKSIVSPPSQVIELGSDDETSQSHLSVTEGIPQRRSDDEFSEEEDEYLLKLKQQAREKARLKKRGIAFTDDKAAALLTAESSQRQPISSEIPFTSAQQHSTPTLPPKKDETIVQILIMTKIPNANPLLVNRKVSQPLQQVREVWCSRQNFDQDMTARIIFTWRGKKLYDTTTSTHLLDVLKKERARQMGGLADDNEEDPSEGRINVEAITRDMYEQQQSRRNREETSVEPKDLTDQDIQDGQSIERSSTPKEPKFKVVLNAQGLDAVQLKVRPSTVISKLMDAFKNRRNLDPGKTCWLVFDGDRLEPDSTVADTEIEDGDAVEVHVR